MPDVVDLITRDHEEMKRLFGELQNNRTARPGLVPVLTTLITAHERAEEAEVYPAARAAGGTDDVEHSQEEHIEADQLLAQLVATDPESTDFDAVLAKVVESVTHHLEEEESTVLTHMRENIDGRRLDELGRAFLDSRQQHLGDQPDDITKAELQTQAENLELGATSGLTKEELRTQLRDKAEED